MARMQAVTPDTPNWSKSILHEIVDATNKQLGVIQRDFNRTTATWKTQPRFDMEKATETTSQPIMGHVGTDNQIYIYVSKGTRPHIIRPKNAKVLRFQMGYGAKSRLRMIASFKGGSFGASVYAHLVLHPGTQAREFDDTIAESNQDDFERLIQDAITRGVNNAS